MPEVSIIITAYNFGHLIAETLSSVFSQVFRDFEVIVVDDASTDNTQEVLAGFASERLRCITHSVRRWQSASRNEAIRAARGKCIAFVDADDLWLPNKLQLQVDFLESHPSVGLVYCDIESFDHATGQSLGRISDSVRLPSGDVLASLLISNFIMSPTPVVRRKVFDEVGFWGEAIQKCEDWDLWLRIAARYEVGLVPMVLARRRVHPNAISMVEDLNEFYVDASGDVERAIQRDPQRLGHLRSRALSNIAYSTGKKMWLRGDISDARKMYWRAVRQFPWSLRPYGGLARMALGCILGQGKTRNIALRSLGKWIPS
jgi:glycosyltransferase involved in cell wall biosynthesis